MSRFAAALCALVFVSCAALATGDDVSGPSEDGHGHTAELDLELKLRPLPPDTRKVRLGTDGGGGHVFILEHSDGSVEQVRPETFARRLDAAQRSRPFAFALLNISSWGNVIWVVLGLLGQALFAGRMVFQWLVSEQRRRSIVPVGFWWMSLAGATMLLVYFVWRRDIVGVLGQSTGWVIYVRNLWFIHHPPVPGPTQR